MPTASDYKNAKALPAKPAGPDRPDDGAVRHAVCHLPAHDTDQAAAGPSHPWDNSWIPPEPQQKLRPSKETLRARAELRRQAEQAAREKPNPEPPPISTQPAVPEPPPEPGRKFRYHIDFSTGPNVIPKHHENGRCPCKPWIEIIPGNEFHKSVWHHNYDICPHGRAAREAYNAERRKRRKANANSRKKYRETPNLFRDPGLPREMLPFVYQPLVAAEIQTVLIYYDPVTGQKPPRYANWHQRYPEFPEIARHLASDPNAMIGAVPHSAGAVVTDVDHGDWRQLAEMMGSNITNATRRRHGRHIWSLAPLTGPMPADTGFEIPDQGTKGDTRCLNGYVVLWNYQSIQNALKVKAQHDARAKQQKEQPNQPIQPDADTAGEYPRKLMRPYRSVSVSWPKGANGERPESSVLTDEDLHYQALYDAQDSAARRNLERNAQIFETHRLAKRDLTIGQIARYQHLSQSTVYQYLKEGLPTHRLLFTDELRERAEQDRQQGEQDLQRAIEQAKHRKCDLERMWHQSWWVLLLGLWCRTPYSHPPATGHTTPPTLFGQTGRRPQGRTRDPPESGPEPSGRSPPGLGAAQTKGKQGSRL